MAPGRIGRRERSCVVQRLVGIEFRGKGHVLIRRRARFFRLLLKFPDQVLQMSPFRRSHSHNLSDGEKQCGQE